MSNGSGTTLPLFGFDSSLVPDIDFCVKDASVVESEVITNYEKYFALITQIYLTLGRGDPRRLLLLSVVYQLVVQRSIVDSTGKENLIKYAHGNNLANIGALYGPKRGTRLVATYSTTTLRFSLALPITTDVPIPVGTLAQTGNAVKFATTAVGVILTGQTFVDVPAQAVNPGDSANGFVAGQINQLVSWNSPFLVSVSNTTTSGGGANIESDDHYRARIWMAPESFSVAGPKDAYSYWAASANPDIIDVSVYSGPEVAGQVYIYPLMKGGQLPSQAVLDQVYAICNADDIRPLTDQVFVQAPVTNTQLANVQYWIDDADSQFEAQIITDCQAAFQGWITWQSSEIGLDINPSKLIEMLVDARAKRVVVTTPAFTVIDYKTLAVIDPASVLAYKGMEPK